MDIADRNHILSAIKQLSRKKIPATRKAILNAHFLSKWEKDEQTLDTALGELVTGGSIVRTDEAYALTAEGYNVARQFESRQFGEWMIAAEHSSAYRRFCEKVYGGNRCQFNMMTQMQLDKMLRALNLSNGQYILDLGCGTGSVTEYIATHTGGIVTGIDYSSEAIQFAQKTRDKQQQLSFQVMDMDELHLPAKSFDAVVSIDTLYFVSDLQKTIEAVKGCLRDYGQMGIFYSAKISEEQVKELLAPTETPLAKALEVSGLTFDTWDFTADENEFWERHLTVANELKHEFEAEGNLALYDGRIAEAARELDVIRTDQKRRYFYHVRQWR